MTGRDLDPDPSRVCSAATSRRSTATSASRSSTATSSWSSPELRPTRIVPGLRAHLVGCPACAEEHESLRALLELDSVLIVS